MHILPSLVIESRNSSYERKGFYQKLLKDQYWSNIMLVNDRSHNFRWYALAQICCKLTTRVVSRVLVFNWQQGQICYEWRIDDDPHSSSQIVLVDTKWTLSSHYRGLHSKAISIFYVKIRECMITSQDWEVADMRTSVSFHGMIDNDHRTNQIRGVLGNKTFL